MPAALETGAAAGCAAAVWTTSDAVGAAAAGGFAGAAAAVMGLKAVLVAIGVGWVCIGDSSAMAAGVPGAASSTGPPAVSWDRDGRRDRQVGRDRQRGYLCSRLLTAAACMATPQDPDERHAQCVARFSPSRS